MFEVKMNIVSPALLLNSVKFYFKFFNLLFFCVKIRNFLAATTMWCCDVVKVQYCCDCFCPSQPVLCPPVLLYNLSLSPWLHYEIQDHDCNFLSRSEITAGGRGNPPPARGNWVDGAEYLVLFSPSQADPAATHTDSGGWWKIMSDPHYRDER